jgi:hypothetical protein
MATKAEHLKALKAKHSSLTRNVNGVRETLSDSEFNATIDRWATASAATDARNELIASGGQSANYASFRTDSMIDGSYPTIGDQLDMLFHDITNGKLGKTGSWYQAVKATKDKFTKP